LIDYKISLQGKVVRNRRRDLRLGGERKDGGLENGIDHLDRVPQESGLGWAIVEGCVGIEIVWYREHVPCGINVFR
jgi:hypothetical protein